VYDLVPKADCNRILGQFFVEMCLQTVVMGV
jgi:hypothetical protein